MDICTKQTDSFTTAIPLSLRDHHRSYYAGIKNKLNEPISPPCLFGKSEKTQNKAIPNRKPKPAKAMSDMGNARNAKKLFITKTNPFSRNPIGQ